MAAKTFVNLKYLFDEMTSENFPHWWAENADGDNLNRCINRDLAESKLKLQSFLENADGQVCIYLFQKDGTETIDEKQMAAYKKAARKYWINCSEATPNKPAPVSAPAKQDDSFAQKLFFMTSGKLDEQAKELNDMRGKLFEMQLAAMQQNNKLMLESMQAQMQAQLKELKDALKTAQAESDFDDDEEDEDEEESVVRVAGINIPTEVLQPLIAAGVSKLASWAGVNLPGTMPVTPELAQVASPPKEALQETEEELRLIAAIEKWQSADSNFLEIIEEIAELAQADPEQYKELYYDEIEEENDGNQS